MEVGLRVIPEITSTGTHTHAEIHIHTSTPHPHTKWKLLIKIKFRRIALLPSLSPWYDLSSLWKFTRPPPYHFCFFKAKQPQRRTFQGTTCLLGASLFLSS